MHTPATLSTLTARIVAMIGGLLLVIGGGVWGISAWQAHVRLFSPSELLRLIPSDSSAYVHINLTESTSALQTVSALASVADVLAPGVASLFSDENDQAPKLTDGLGGELALVAPGEGTARVLVGETRSANALIQWLEADDSSVVGQMSGSVWNGTTANQTIAHLLTWPSESEPTTMSVRITPEWFAISADTQSIEAIQQTGDHKRANMGSLFPHSETVRGSLAHGTMTDELESILPDTLALSGERTWWSLRDDNSALRLDLRTGAVPAFDLGSIIGANTGAVQAPPAHASDIRIRVFGEALAGGVGAVGQLASIVLGDTLSTLLDTAPLSIAEMTIRPAGGTNRLLLRLRSSERTGDALAASVETVLTRLLAREAPVAQERTLYDGTIVRELLPNPGAVTRTPQTIDDLTADAWGVGENTAPKWYVLRDDRDVTIAEDLDILRAYVTNTMSEVPCGDAGALAVTLPASSLTSLPLSDDLRISLVADSADTPSEIAACIY